MISLSTASLFMLALMAAGPLLLRHNNKYRAYILLFINLLVYVLGASSPLQLLIAALWVLLPYVLLRTIGRSFNKGLLIIPMVVIFAYLMKYDTIFELLHIPYAFAFKLLGLSYFLFREIDFIMQYDYLKEEGVRISLPDYLNYVLSFYTLLAGPILRYEEFVQVFYETVTPFEKGELLRLVNRIVNGYVKVYIISSLLGYWAGIWFDGLNNHSGIISTAAAFVVFAYLNGWFIYFNFSGYCDIVNGFAHLAHLPVHENFNQPYLARSVTEFWNRHHITLSEWIRDYIYSPFFKWLISGPCGNNIKLGNYIALFFTFTVAGIWHGTDANYLVYGLFQGLGIVVATWWKDHRKKWLGKERNKAYEKSLVFITIGRCVTWMYICLTFSFVGYDVVGWMLQR